MKDEHRAILRELLKRTRMIEAGDLPGGRRSAAGDAPRVHRHGPLYAFGQWFGNRPEAIRQRYRRAIGDLEHRGLIETHSRFGGKLTNLRLTNVGRDEAEHLESEATVAAAL